MKNNVYNISSLSANLSMIGWKLMMIFIFKNDLDVATKGKWTRVPYRKIDDGAVEVNGLPNGIPFKKPSNCSKEELSFLKDHMDSISFTGI